MIDMLMAAERITGERRESGMTQQELANRLGVSVQAVSKWERAQSLPEIGTLLELAGCFGVSVEYLLGGGEAPARRRSLYEYQTGDLLYAARRDPIALLIPPDVCERLGQDGLRELPAAIMDARRRILEDAGVLLPIIRVRDEAALPDGRCALLLGGIQVDDAAVDDSTAEGVALTAEAMLRGHLASFVNRHMVKLLVERLREDMPFAVEGVIPERVTLSRLTRVLRALTAAGRPARSLLPVVEALDTAFDTGADDAAVLEELTGEPL